MKLNSKFERRCKLRSAVIATIMSIILLILAVTSKSVYGQEGQEEEQVYGEARKSSIVSSATSTTPSDISISQTQPMQGMENLENRIDKVKFEEPIDTASSIEQYVPHRSTSQGFQMPEKNKEFENGKFIALNDVDVYDFPNDSENTICMDTIKKGEIIEVNCLYGEYFQTSEYTFVKATEFERFYEPLTSLSTQSSITTKSGASAKEINDILKETDLKGLGNVIIEVQEEYNINALFIVGVMKLESANGDSRLAQNKNNLFGIAAYDDSPYSSAFHYISKEECVRDFGRIIHEYYIDCDRETVHEINQKYSSSSSWARKVVELANDCYVQISKDRASSIENDSKLINGIS